MTENSNDKKIKKKKIEHILTVAALVFVILAWVLGALRQEADLEPFLKQAMPEADSFEPVAPGVYEAKKGTGGKIDKFERIGHVAIGKGSGYAGPLTAVTALDGTGKIIRVVIVNHKETIPFFRKVLAKEFPGSLAGKSYNDPFAPGEDVDGVSGATLSLNALLNASRDAARRTAGDVLNLPVAPAKAIPIQVGIPELLLVLLFAAGFLGYSKKISDKAPKTKKAMRWVSRIIGLLFLGFVFTIPLSIININSLLMGYLPVWQTHLYWYLLVLGVLLPLILMEKSPYCDNFCPFGSAQEVLKLIGGARQRIPDKHRQWLRWMQRVLALAVIVAALFFRNPGKYNYEVFGTFFNLTGNYVQYGVMAVVLVTSLFITRPWCNYLCPLRAVSDYIRSFRSLFKKESLRPVSW